MSEYDPLLTMTALNLAVVSLHRITSAKDRLILDREYTGIINNLRMGEINADHELTSLYQEIVRVINMGRLRDELRTEIEAVYSLEKQKSIKDIISGNLARSFNSNALVWLGKLAASCATEYFRTKAKAELQSEAQNLRLKSEELDEYDELQRKLLGSSWKLLRQYMLPDSYRLTQNALDKFYSAIQEADSSKRLRMLKYIEGEFAMYSPYWFYRMRSAQEAGDQNEADESFRKFCEVWRPVLRKDPYKVEALKYRIDGLMSGGLTEERAGEILKCLAEMGENTPLEDWANNIYMGMMYFTLGLKDKAIESVMCNLDFEFETENSERLLAKFEREIPPKSFAAISAKSPEAPKPETVREVREEPEVPPRPEPEPKPKKQSLKARAESGDPEAQYELGLSYEKRKDTRALASAVICTWLGVGWLVLHYLLPSSFFWCSLWIVFVCFIAFVLGVNINNMPEEYYEPRVIKWFTKAAENGHVEAMRSLAEIYRKNNEPDEAMRWYKKVNAEALKMFDDIQPRESVPQPEPVREPDPVSAPPTSPEDIRKSAEYGDAESQYTLGMMYFNGQGVFMDYKEAVKWLEIAGNAGHSWAQLQLGRMYYSGIGVKKDERHGVNRMKKAAELGNAEAQYTLAKIYRQGNWKNFQQALAWCSAAAVQNHHEAQVMLAEMYRDSGDKRQYQYWRKKVLEHNDKNRRHNI